MIVYGDRERLVCADAMRDSVLRALSEATRAEPGIARHSALVDAFIEAGELMQGLADAEFKARGFDGPSPRQHRGAELLLRLAKAIDRSWRTAFADLLDLRGAMALLETLGDPCPIRVRTCEGYAHYALYPESYLEAARRSGLDAETCVIGIRSIGVGLAALVAAAVGAKPAITLRPVGHPFDREIRADPSLVAEALSGGSAFAIVDEGPGLSGSSFAAVARWLTEQGVPLDRMHFFPSHDGEPGAAAAPHIRAVWDRARRHNARQDEIILHRNGLAEWLHDLVVPIGSLVEDLSAGRWRLVCGAALPCDTRFERRKILLRTEQGDWLAKFAGLGRIGRHKLRDAMMLADAGLIPDIAGLRHGFILQRWVAVRPLAQAPDRSKLLQRLASYLAWRAVNMPATESGASLARLTEMAVQNSAEALGAKAADALDGLLARFASIEACVRPVRTDNRLHAWEWLWTARGLLKADALDHCRGQDLVGCQDIAWDVAGAVVEFGLSETERRRLSAAIAANGAPEPDARLVEALLPCYLAFQMGLWSTASSPQGGGQEEPDRAGFYAAGLKRRLFPP